MIMRRGYHFGDLWNEMSRLNRDMSMFFNEVPRRTGSGVYPHLNVYDDGESFIVRAEIPGIDPKDLDLKATADALTIKGERKPLQDNENASFHRREREHGVFSRSLSLAQPVNPDKIQASYKLGILEVILPKAEEARPRKIGVTA